MPVIKQLVPTRRLTSKSATRLRSSSLITVGSSSKEEVESQHVNWSWFVVHWSGVTGGGFLRTGVAEAVTLLAKAMAATRETRGLWNSIVKTVWR